MYAEPKRIIYSQSIVYTVEQNVSAAVPMVTGIHRYHLIGVVRCSFSNKNPTVRGA